MRIHRLVDALLATSLLLVTGCGGGGTVRTAQSLSGLIEVDNFSLPAGETRRVDGDLTIRATGDITIEGQLLVDDGAQVVLDAADELVLGPISPSGQVTPQGRTDFPSNSVTIATRSSFRSDQTWPRRTNLNVVSRGANGTVTINGSITIEDALDGRSRLQNGSFGGGVEVGSPKALSAAQGLQIVGATEPATLVVNANIKAGDGGDGGDDLLGSAGENPILDPGSGGWGGSIALSANNLTYGAGVKLTAGKGGEAGWGGRARGGASGFFKAPSGSTLADVGDSVSCNTGQGGTAGSVTVTATTTTGAADIPLVAGGQASSFFATPGDGGLAAPGGNLRFSQIALSKNSRSQDTVSTAVIIIPPGGNGGRAPDKNSVGGPGGRLLGDKPDGFSFTLNGCFRGGRGFDGCSASPQIEGTAGGPGGTMPNALASVPLFGRAFDGGDAGDYGAGFAPNGGDGGKTEGGTKVARNGFPGYPCAQVAAFMVLTADIVVNGATLARAGDSVQVKRFRGFIYSGPEGGCDSDHLHGTVFFDDKGPIADPNPTGCGHAHLP